MRQTRTGEAEGTVASKGEQALRDARPVTEDGEVEEKVKRQERTNQATNDGDDDSG